MACRGCGSAEVRTIALYDAKGDMREEKCKRCHPESFDGAFSDPTDRRIWAGPEAFPHLYKRDDNGIYHATDSSRQQTVDLMMNGPTQNAIEKKRRTRRTEPMTASEVEKANQWGARIAETIKDAEAGAQ